MFQVALRWPANQPPDLFGAVCLKGSDTLIADAHAPAIAQRLPTWYLQQVNAPSFLLLPMLMKQAPFALIYADQANGWLRCWCVTGNWPCCARLAQPGGDGVPADGAARLEWHDAPPETGLVAAPCRMLKTGVTSLTPALVTTVGAASFPT